MTPEERDEIVCRQLNWAIEKITRTFQTPQPPRAAWFSIDDGHVQTHWRRTCGCENEPREETRPHRPWIPEVPVCDCGEELQYAGTSIRREIKDEDQ